MNSTKFSNEDKELTKAGLAICVCCPLSVGLLFGFLFSAGIGATASFLTLWVIAILAAWTQTQSEAGQQEENRQFFPCTRNYSTCKCNSCRRTRTAIIKGGDIYNSGHPEPANWLSIVRDMKELEEQLEKEVGHIPEPTKSDSGLNVSPASKEMMPKATKVKHRREIHIK